MTLTKSVLLLLFGSALSGCSEPQLQEQETEPASASTSGADLILTNARVYSLAWPDPDVEGVPSADAPRRDGIWSPDAAAIAVRDGLILAVGSVAEIDAYRSSTTRVIDLGGATAIPGLIESHGHYNELGEQAERVDVSEAATTQEMADQLRDRVASTAPGEWIVGGGWDEGAWADALPTNTEINRISPANPVVLLGRRGFGLLANQQALTIAGISMETPSPSGGEVVKGADGEPTGVLLNRARALVLDIIPAANLASKKQALVVGLNAIAAGGYVTGHHAGVYADYMPAYESLAAEGALPIRVEVMLAARPENRELMEQWIGRGPTRNPAAFLQVRSVKAYYDGSLGSRGAKMLADYSDLPGHTGTAGKEYGFPEELVAAAISAGFQVGVHAIGDAGNRAVLDFYERVLPANPHNAVRHRIEHAQIIHPDDFARIGAMQVVASMEPGHAVEDSPWAEERVGAERIKGGYAWRTLRRAGAGLIFNSDLAGTDFDIFYGLHCAVTRTDREGQPAGGWYPEQAVTIEEAIRAYTIWPARASSRENLTGTLEPGKWADITVLSIDPFATADLDPDDLMTGEALMTIVAGDIVHNKLAGAE